MAKASSASAANETAGVGHNQAGAGETEVLFFVDRRLYLAALEAQKHANKAMKDVGKTIKADLGVNGLTMIKAYEKAQTPEGKAEIQAKQEAERQAMGFAGIPINTQLDLLTDRMPLVDRAFRDGREAGLRGDTLANPYNEASPEGQEYAKGWHEGQTALFAGITAKQEAAAELIEGPGHDDGGDLDRGNE